jgi:hypothetical protein
MNVRALVIPVSLCLVILAMGCTPPAAVAPVPTTAATSSTAGGTDVVNVIPQRRDDVAPGFTVEVACSETDLRKPVAIIRWNASSSFRADDQRLDVTVFKDGFERGEFATIDPQGGRARMARPSTEGLLESGGARMIRPLDLTVAPRSSREAAPDDGGMTVIEVQNLEPGVLYQWRMVGRAEAGFGATETVAVEAPVCVADEAGRNQ